MFPYVSSIGDGSLMHHLNDDDPTDKAQISRPWLLLVLGDG
jgi:hypothetical protein